MAWNPLQFLADPSLAGDTYDSSRNEQEAGFTSGFVVYDVDVGAIFGNAPNVITDVDVISPEVNLGNAAKNPQWWLVALVIILIFVVRGKR